LEQKVGKQATLDAIDIAAFFMAITIIVDSDGHSHTLADRIMTPIVRRSMLSYAFVVHHKLAVSLVVGGVAIGALAALRYRR